MTLQANVALCHYKVDAEDCWGIIFTGTRINCSISLEIIKVVFGRVWKKMYGIPKITCQGIKVRLLKCTYI